MERTLTSAPALAPRTFQTITKYNHTAIARRASFDRPDPNPIRSLLSAAQGMERFGQRSTVSP